MKHAVSIMTMLLLLLGGAATPSFGYRDYFTPEQKQKLANIQTVRVDVIALTDKGKVDAGAIQELVVSRMEDLGYTVVTGPSDPHDVVFRVKCEQYKTWEGTARQGGDADLPDSPSRLWKGPACQLTYVLGGMKIDWQKEVRADFADPAAAAVAAGWDDPGLFAINHLRSKLSAYDFPILIAAEWGHADRLLALLERRGGDMRKLQVIALLGEMQADEALPKLKQALRDKDLAKQAALAIGNIGSDGIPLLVDLLKNAEDPEIQAAAAKGLGRVGGIAGDPSIVDPLLDMLDPPGGIDIRVQTEVVWALGKMPDKRAIKPLNQLFAKVLKIRDPENKELEHLKEALNWSIKQVDVSGHIS